MDFTKNFYQVLFCYPVEIRPLICLEVSASILPWITPGLFQVFLPRFSSKYHPRPLHWFLSGILKNVSWKSITDFQQDVFRNLISFEFPSGISPGISRYFFRILSRIHPGFFFFWNSFRRFMQKFIPQFMQVFLWVFFLDPFKNSFRNFSFYSFLFIPVFLRDFPGILLFLSSSEILSEIPPGTLRGGFALISSETL